MRKLQLGVFILFLLTLVMCVRPGAIWAKTGWPAVFKLFTWPREHAAGEPIEIKTIIKGKKHQDLFYEVEIAYGGGWWGGGSGPASAQYSQQRWVACGPWHGCTEWWQGTVPPGQREVITIPVSTSLSHGTYHDAVKAVLTTESHSRTKAITIVQ